MELEKLGRDALDTIVEAASEGSVEAIEAAQTIKNRGLAIISDLTTGKLPKERAQTALDSLTHTMANKALLAAWTGREKSIALAKGVLSHVITALAAI